jgi:hypothetical protein
MEGDIEKGERVKLAVARSLVLLFSTGVFFGTLYLLSGFGFFRYFITGSI